MLRENAKALGFADPDKELENRNHLRHATRWWLRAASFHSATAAAPWRLTLGELVTDAARIGLLDESFATPQRAALTLNATLGATAELATPDAWELRQRVDGQRAFLDRQLEDRLTQAADGLAMLRHRLERCAPERDLVERRRGLADLEARLERAVGGDLRLRQAAAASLAQRLESLGPRSVLARGYAHVQRLRDGRTVASTKDVGAAEGLTITVADGHIAAVTTGQARLF